MLNLAILRIITYIMFRCSILLLLLGLGLLVSFNVGEGNSPSVFSDINFTPAGATGLLTLLYRILVYVGFAFQVYALYRFNKTLDFFYKRVVFDEHVAANFKKSGSAILLGYALIVIPFLVNALTVQKVQIGFNFLLNNTLLVPALGLFFLVLSEVFLMAKKMKEDNELTV